MFSEALARKITHSLSNINQGNKKDLSPGEACTLCLDTRRQREKSFVSKHTIKSEIWKTDVLWVLSWVDKMHAEAFILECFCMWLGAFLMVTLILKSSPSDPGWWCADSCPHSPPLRCNPGKRQPSTPTCSPGPKWYRGGRQSYCRPA